MGIMSAFKARAQARKNYQLIVAAEEGKLDAVKRLLKDGADINATTDTRRKPPLITALIHDHPEIARFLIESGADIHQKYEGSTALTWAAAGGHDDIARLLIEKGAEDGCKDSFNRTAGDWARHEGHAGTAGTIMDYSQELLAKRATTLEAPLKVRKLRLIGPR